MELNYNIIEFAITVEVIIIVLIIISSYVLTAIIYVREQANKKAQKDIKTYLRKQVLANQSFSVERFPRKWKKMHLLFPVIEELNKFYSNDSSWEPIAKGLMTTVMLPLARKYAHSRIWIYRFYACKTFESVAEKKDADAIFRLTNDSVPLVYIHSIKAAIQCCSEKAVKNIISRMAETSWITQSVCSEFFKNAPTEVQNMIENVLLTSKEEGMREVAYDLMRQFHPKDLKLDVTEDVNSDNIELRIAALKYITHVNKDKALPFLIKALEDKWWKLKVVALHRLSLMDASGAIKAIAACLDDPGWAVRNSAAEALKALGPEGEKELRARAIELDDMPFKAKDRLSKMLW